MAATHYTYGFIRNISLINKGNSPIVRYQTIWILLFTINHLTPTVRIIAMHHDVGEVPEGVSFALGTARPGSAILPF